MKTIKINRNSWSELTEEIKTFTGIIKYLNDDIEYRVNGKLHRLDGPAFIGYNAYKAYWINGKFICYSNNIDYEQIFYNSKEYKKAILLENMMKIKNIV